MDNFQEIFAFSIEEAPHHGDEEKYREIVSGILEEYFGVIEGVHSRERISK